MWRAPLRVRCVISAQRWRSEWRCDRDIMRASLPLPVCNGSTSYCYVEHAPHHARDGNIAWCQSHTSRARVDPCLTSVRPPVYPACSVTRFRASQNLYVFVTHTLTPRKPPVTSTNSCFLIIHFQLAQAPPYATFEGKTPSRTAPSIGFNDHYSTGGQVL